MEQILEILCLNAKDALQDARRKIRLETRNVKIDKVFCRDIPNAKPGHYVCCSVTDNGCGIPIQVQKKVFDPFFTTKTNADRSGLGLTTVFCIMQQNKGFIHLLSKPGLGTTVKLYFPRLRDESASAPEVPNTRSEPCKRKKTP